MANFSNISNIRISKYRELKNERAGSVGQTNALRGNDRQADFNNARDFGACLIEDSEGLFEPDNCTKGDGARVWLYMQAMYGVEISPAEHAMFVQ